MKTVKKTLSDATVNAFISEWNKTSDQSKGRIELLLTEWYVKCNLSALFDTRSPQQMWDEIFSAEDVRSFVLDTSIRLLFNLKSDSVSCDDELKGTVMQDMHLLAIEHLADCFSTPGYGPAKELDIDWFPVSGPVQNSKVWLYVSSDSIKKLLMQHSWLLTVVLMLLFYEDIQEHPKFAPEMKSIHHPVKKDLL